VLTKNHTKPQQVTNIW